MNKLIIDTLKPLNIPVTFQKNSGTTFPYITFFTYLAQGEEFSDDKEIGTGYYVQIDLWSKGDYTSLTEQVKTLLYNQGFMRKSEADLYEEDTQVYHKALRFFYLKEV